VHGSLRWEMATLQPTFINGRTAPIFIPVPVALRKALSSGSVIVGRLLPSSDRLRLVNPVGKLQLLPPGEIAPKIVHLDQLIVHLD
jgi:hypothetical protein